MTQQVVDSLEVGIHVSNLYRELDELLERDIRGLRQLLTAYVAYEAVEEDFALLFTEVGNSSPVMAATYLEAERRCSLTEERLRRLECLPAIRAEALQRLLDKHPDTTGDPVVLAVELDGITTLGDVRQLVLRQNLIAGNLRPRGVVRLPPAAALTVTHQGIGVIETVTAVHEPRHLEAALTLWEPYTEGSAYETFNEALQAAALLD